MKSLKITIPGAIPRELSPNWQPPSGSGAWKKNKIGLEYQYLVFIRAMNARNLWERNNHYIKWLPIEKATLQITVYYEGRQKRQDDANLTLSLKSAIDALCTTNRKLKGAIGEPRFRAEIIVDDKPECLTILKPLWVKGEPAVEMLITEVE